MRRITFHADIDLDDCYAVAKTQIEDGTIKCVMTSQLSLLSFDLLEHFENIYFVCNGTMYELKLGKNTWTPKELRVSHNLFKIVQSHFLNNI
jgi:hypothetical protein